MAQKDPGENGAPAANSQEEDPSCCTCEGHSYIHLTGIGHGCP